MATGLELPVPVPVRLLALSAHLPPLLARDTSSTMQAPLDNGWGSPAAHKKQRSTQLLPVTSMLPHGIPV
ncbi:hypothetical protein GJ744_011089 [Endocarpon pusillum]|uniref:Uncharacterized protein n=1 Tax=Endocarpon pusillum TaxID=364733 RepID=A0A8H7AD72_9EURO|nr:hypothetical protein GJ744_011089 [Endocarpon pusillum]